MARVLMLSYLPVYPADGGGRVRVYQLATQLARRHSVTVVCPPLESLPSRRFPFAVEEAGSRGARQLFDPRVCDTALRVARRERPDYLLLEYVWQGLHAGVVRLARQLPLLLDAFDVATERFRRTRHPLWPLISLYERAVLRSADRVFAVSRRDEAQLVRLGARATHTSVVPNGVDTQAFRPDRASRLRVREELGVASWERLLLFFGSLDYPPNAEAVRVLAREIMPRLDERYRLVVAGRGDAAALRRYESGRVRLAGRVERIADYVNAADAVVAPILRGSGTRLKVLESVACGAPTVATPAAVEGLDLAACGPALTVARDWDSFAMAVQRVASAQRLPPSERFVATYDWQHIVERMVL